MSLIDWVLIAGCLVVCFLVVFVVTKAVLRQVRRDAESQEDSGDSVWKVEENGLHDFTGSHDKEGEGPIKVVDPDTGEVVRRCKNYDEARAWTIIEAVNNAKGRMVMFNIEDERED